MMHTASSSWGSAAVAVAAFVLAVRHPDSLVFLALRVQLAHRPPSAERAASARADQPALGRGHGLARSGGDSRGASRHRGRSPDVGPVTRPVSESQPGALFRSCVGLSKIVSCFARGEVLGSERQRAAPHCKRTRVLCALLVLFVRFFKRVMEMLWSVAPEVRSWLLSLSLSLVLVLLLLLLLLMLFWWFLFARSLPFAVT